MTLHRTVWFLVAAVLTMSATAESVEEITLHAPQYPERNTVPLEFIVTSRAPSSIVEAKVTYRDGQAQVELNYDMLKPAVLFGGDVTCYVVWAVARGQRAENLGELPAGSKKGSSRYTTAQKSFALMITAEPYYLVREPSALVMFANKAPTKKRITSDSFTFSSFAKSPDHALESIANVAWDSDTPLEVIQAEKAYEIAGRVGAQEFVPDIYQEATVALTQARNLARGGRKKETSDYSRRVVALSNDAISISLSRIEARELEAEIASRRAEMEALEARVAAANEETARLNEEAARLNEERNQLESAMNALREEQTALTATVGKLEADRQRLKTEKRDLSAQLQGALSQVADTQSTARGMIVNLPDILFDLNESTLKPEAKLVIAKLAGILLIMSDLNLRIEGHTDSTGSADYNQRLSERRAESVYDFLFEQGIEAMRMTVEGYGQERPIADNTTKDGRSKNRRVEIVIAEGVVAEADDVR